MFRNQCYDLVPCELGSKSRLRVPGFENCFRLVGTSAIAFCIKCCTNTSRYRKESEWINDLVVARADYHNAHHKHRPARAPQHHNATAPANGHTNGHTAHHGALVHEPEDDLDDCVNETVRAAEEAVEVHEAHLGRHSRQNSQPLSAKDPNAKAEKNWPTAKRRVYRKNRFTKAAKEEVLLRHRIVREKTMHRQLLKELAQTDRELTWVLDTIDPPKTRDPDTNPKSRQSSDAIEMSSSKSGRTREPDEETAMSHSARSSSFPRAKNTIRRLRAWLQHWDWHRLSKLFIHLLPVSTKYRRKMEIAMEWLPKRGKAMELQRRREALGNRVVFATLAMIGSRLSDQELRGSMHELLVKELVDTTRAADAENDGVQPAMSSPVSPLGRHADAVSS